ncbi:MAG: hypothetical protein ACRD8O_19980 [Bryobacteraceae bacterium]
MVYTSATQVAAILPSTGTVNNLTVTYNGSVSSAAQIRVESSSFGSFAINQAGNGPGVVQNFVSATDQPLNRLNASARPGQTLILWGTGLGPVSGNEAAGPRPGNLTVPTELYAGGQRAVLSYAGRSGCCAGIDQIAFVVPPGVEGCYVPVAVKAGNVVSNITFISVAAQGELCSDFAGLSSEELNRLISSGSARVGTVSLARVTVKVASIVVTQDIGGASFGRYTAERLLASQGPYGSPSPGACLFAAVKGTDNLVVTDPVRPDPLDAGAVLTVTGPKGTKQLVRDQPGNYSGQLGGGVPLAAPEPLFLDPGTYTVDGSGGADIGAFRATINIRSGFDWTNEAQVNTIPVNQDLTVTWTGGEPGGQALIFGISASEPLQIGTIFLCIERADVGRFTVSSLILANMLTGAPPNTIGLLTVGTLSPPVPFTASGLDAGGVVWSPLVSKAVVFQGAAPPNVRK